MNLPFLAGNNNAGRSDSPQLLSNGWPAAWIENDPDADATSPKAVFEAAKLYVASGLSVVPIDAFDADKSPDPRRLKSWKIYQLRRPRLDELQVWHDHGGPFGLAVVAGAVSGGQPGYGLEIIDFDRQVLSFPWTENVEARAPGLIARMVRVTSPRPGAHFYYRCSQWGESQKLACEAIVDANGQPTKVTTIETRGEGAYCLAPPSPRRCHPSNRLYRLVEGSPPLNEVPFISPEERSILLEEARKFNRCVEPEHPVQRHNPTTRRCDGNRPGDFFEREVTWAEILEPCGWVLVGYRGDIEDWRRPGKDYGISATVNYGDRGWLHVFSTNADHFEDGCSYSKFTAFALLNHGGDFNKAAKALQEDGYGPKSLPAGKRPVSGGVHSITLSNN